LGVPLGRSVGPRSEVHDRGGLPLRLGRHLGERRLLGERARELQLADPALSDESLTEALTRQPLALERLHELLPADEPAGDEDLAELAPPLARARAHVLLRLAHPRPVLGDDLRKLRTLHAEALDEDLAELLPGLLLQLERDDELALGHEPSLDEERADESVGDGLRKGHIPCIGRPSNELEGQFSPAGAWFSARR